MAQAVLRALGMLPATPAAPAVSPLPDLVWGLFRRVESSAAPSAATAAAASTGANTVVYSVTNDWGAGHVAALTLTAGQSALNGWTVEFDTPAQIVNIWNGQVTSHVGTHYVIANMSYNAKLAAGQSTGFGYQATPGAVGSAPANIKVNGVAIGTVAPPSAPALSISDVSVTEGNSGTANANFTVSLSKASATPVTVGYTTANGTATAGTDYTAATGTLTFAAGTTSQTVAVKVRGDTVVEPSETFTVTLTKPTGATLAQAKATGTITNDDGLTAPGLSISDVSVTEGNSGTPNANFTVSLSKASATPVTVGYTTANGTATAGTDYTAATGTLTFAAGTTSQTVAVKIIGDTVVEPSETFTVTLTKPSGATLARATATATLTNDDVVITPGLSISDASATEPGSGGIAPGYLHTSGNQIVDSQGKPVQLSSVNWFGAESTTLAPHGLWTRSYKDMIDQMAVEGFNTIRLPYSSEMLHTTAKPNGIDFSQNPDLQGLSALEVMDKVIGYAGQKGMRVVLDHHRSTAGAGTSENGLWYNSQYTEDQWASDWQMLAGHYKNNPTVIGFDLHNEPYNGTWGGGGANDWARAAERAGNAVLAVNPDLLIFTEGVGTYKGQSYWWGGNLMGVKDRPITLDVANRVVYSPHDYPSSVFAQPWFQAADFGANLPNVFRQAWGYIYQDNIAPIWVGEFGTKLTDPKDAVWFEAITSYLSGDFDNNGTIDIPAGSQDMSWAYWAWNPNSGDTGGILADDWRTVNENKMAYLTPIEYTGGSGTSLASFTVTLAAPSAQAVAVQYATSNGTATAGSDYASASGTLTFAPGETRKTITVVVNSDSLTEGTEDFRVMLSNPTGATLTDAMGMATINDRPTGTTTSG
ncbi:MAG: Calx-beta domain-containing protein, partial [Mycobacteriaceae bacterium]